MIETFQAVLPHGITLSCRAAGPAQGPRVLLLHGFPEAAFVWDGVMQALAPHARCLAPNLRGAERAFALGVHKVDYVTSVSRTHNLKNVRREREESLTLSQMPAA